MSNEPIILKTEYHSNGAKEFEQSIVDVDGEELVLNKRWYENGVTASEERYHPPLEPGDEDDSYIDSHFSWRDDGQIRDVYILNKPHKVEYDIGDTISYKQSYEYYDNGQVKSERHYKEIFTDIAWGYENDPVLVKEAKANPSKKDIFHGKSIDWYENGTKCEEGKSINGQRQGLWTEWFEDGQKKLEASYKDNQQDGEMTNWDSDGDVIGYRLFKEGELVWSNNSDKKIDFNILALQGGSLAMTDEEVAETCDTFPNELLHTPFMNLWLTWYYFLSNLEAEDDDSDVPFQALEKQFNKLKNIIPSEHWIEISKEYYPNLTSDWWMDEGKLLSACKFCYSKHTPDSL